ncbi:potassium channel protein [Hydrogenimonas sp.]|nr:potassium channel protein [Hydrogenimonas sp.]
MFDIKSSNLEIVLFGYGSTGAKVYEMLSSSFSKITVVDSDPAHIERAKENGIVTSYLVDITNDSELEELGLDGKILFCAMDEMALNIFLALSLKSISKDSTLLSISTSAENTRKLKFIGVDKVIDIYESSANRIVDIIIRPAVTRVMDEIIYVDNGINIEEIEIPPNSFLDGKCVQDVNFREYGLILIGISDKELGEDFIFVSRGINHKFDPGDILVVMGETQALEDFYKRLMERR